MSQGDIYKLRMSSSLYGVQCLNIFHYKEDVAASSGLPETDLLDSFVAEVIPPLLEVLAEPLRIHCVSATNLTNTGAQPVDKLLPSNTHGAVVDVALPANKVYVANYYTDQLTRSGRGRKYFSGVPAAWEDDNAIYGNAKTTCDAVADALQLTLTAGSGGGGWEPVIYSPTTLNAYDVFKVIFSAEVHLLTGRTARRC